MALQSAGLFTTTEPWACCTYEERMKRLKDVGEQRSREARMPCSGTPGFAAATGLPGGRNQHAIVGVGMGVVRGVHTSLRMRSSFLAGQGRTDRAT